MILGSILFYPSKKHHPSFIDEKHPNVINIQKCGDYEWRELTLSKSSSCNTTSRKAIAKRNSRVHWAENLAESLEVSKKMKEDESKSDFHRHSFPLDSLKPPSILDWHYGRLDWKGCNALGLKFVTTREWEIEGKPYVHSLTIDCDIYSRYLSIDLWVVRRRFLCGLLCADVTRL